MSEHPDQADLHQAGKPLPGKDNVRPIALNVPRVLTVADLLTASVMKLNEASSSMCTTGSKELDLITGGFKPGFTWLMGADTSFGKSSWLIAFTDDNIRARKRVLIVSSEDTEEVYGDRLMVRRSRVDAMRYRDKSLEPKEKERVRKQAELGEEVPVFVDARRYPVEDLAGHLRTIIRENKVDLVCFDYVQEFQTKKRHQDERVKFREIASVLRHVIKDAKISGVLFSQLTVDQHTKIPTRRNIRECRDMANAAEVIVIGFEPDAELKDANGNEVAREGDKCFYVDKVKNGPRNRIVKMPWNETHACFETPTWLDAKRFDEECERTGGDLGDFAEDQRYP